jgi:transcription elongation factor GreA
MMDKVYLTQEGYDKMAAELEDMLKRQRVEMAERLRFAIQQGDLSENADYHKAKEDQAFLEGKIKDYTDKIGRAEIIEKKKSKGGGIVEIGSMVTIKQDDYPEEEYHLVGAAEANPREGKISNESPIGKAILGYKAGDEVVAETPGGEMKLKIIKVD